LELNYPIDELSYNSDDVASIPIKKELMEKISATEAQNKFGELLDSARREPIEITEKGRGVAVVLAVEEFERLQAVEDELWGLRAKEASNEGYIGIQASEDLLKELLGAES
jgi:prevent-host-death family protein